MIPLCVFVCVGGGGYPEMTFSALLKLLEEKYIQVLVYILIPFSKKWEGGPMDLHHVY